MCTHNVPSIPCALYPMCPISHVHTQLSAIYKPLFGCAAHAHLVALAFIQNIMIEIIGQNIDARNSTDAVHIAIRQMQCTYSVHVRKFQQEWQGKRRVAM